MGAVATGGVRVLNDQIVQRLVWGSQNMGSTRWQRASNRNWRGVSGLTAVADVRGRTVILVDDSLATGATLRAVVRALRKLQPARIVVAVPPDRPRSAKN
jgi:putative phosphoribosyl transferase